MDLTQYTGQQLLTQIDNRAFWGSLQVSAWWYNRKKQLTAPDGRTLVFFELYGSAVLDHLGNLYDDSLAVARAWGFQGAAAPGLTIEDAQAAGFNLAVYRPVSVETVFQGRALGFPGGEDVL